MTEVAAAEVHQERAEPGGSGSGGVAAFFAGRPATHPQYAAASTEEVRQLAGRGFFQFEVTSLEATRLQRADERGGGS